ncbi:ATP-grasp domain-containing protein [Mycobacterium sp. CBMA293]|uniref:acetyl/propionyl/methylcrotonyl-CoA carboxylase subunit alpha n=1 Tax=unclassified Mycolicibacterium TaxID=2636767 RepID=UPI0012DDF2E2|nr:MULTISPECIES: biotin carboxylase N-terminal domain-containing protein [unclassified Mycolicibacterium]MUL46292.1 ATP-grasp domain-containing protein [Mycolicibacterium sp. CBMA 360]MUL57197.1 ATP-grasp domain-containing protein [Mycolicibacterium sp. CBMA 335]MUL70237.1 ATP-grasp domain-containing protein [Mycolicibacterium sp. CBMA 311]MUL92285.1 ATP-grasp domain-containing protein [Mycolicibacterium sp. CBMA 230]MUM04783.1 acetyl/propionyl-CoA carboxylase subunit alpha [Mycolicibacterium 
MKNITTLLIANRGEIASRIIRTAHAMDIKTVAVYSDADRDAPYVHEADESVHLPGTAPADTYLRADLILEAVQRTGADAVHPGYGFLSENAAFAQSCIDNNVIFVGPSPAAITAMGSKIAAKDMMRAAGVPVLPGVTIGADSDDDPAALRTAAAGIGFPILVKAAFGGGGRGMRIVHDEASLVEAVHSAQREAASAFGDGTVFLEKFVESPRHIEVQIFGDSHGTVVHLGERECSIQRRYQKIIEEAPSTAVDAALRDELGRAAVAAGKALEYEGAGTVEFVMATDGSFYFLEVNTRLQVEHPVTELVTGLDLVRAQLIVADGQPLPSEMLDTAPLGHAVEVRLYAEDVAAGFIPASGVLTTLEFPNMEGIRIDSGFASGSKVSTFYDPMLAKVIAYGPTRDDACSRLARALSETRVHGVTTNRDLLVGILREPEFRRGAIDTGYLERHDPAVLMGCDDVRTVHTHAIAAALAAQAQRRAQTSVLPGIPSGWRTLVSQPQTLSFTVGEATIDVHYRFEHGSLTVRTGDIAQQVQLISAAGNLVDAQINGVRRRYRITRSGSTYFVDSALGSTALHEVERFPNPNSFQEAGSLLAPMPGSVVRVEVAEGTEVSAGTPIVVLEAMKMEHTVRAPADGLVTSISVAAGDQVDSGQVLAVVHGGDL